MSRKVATPLTPTRRKAALMVLRAREARGWSQERAALELGIGVRTLRDIEAGKARMTALEALIVLSTALQRREAVSVNTGDVVQGLPGTKPEPALVRCAPTEVHGGVAADRAPRSAEANHARVSSSADPRGGGSPSCSATGAPASHVSGSPDVETSAAAGELAPSRRAA